MLSRFVGGGSVFTCWPSLLVKMFIYCNDHRTSCFPRPRILTDLSLILRHNESKIKAREVLLIKNGKRFLLVGLCVPIVFM